MTTAMRNAERMPLNDGSSMNEIITRADFYYKDGMDAYSEHVVSEDRSKKMYLALLAMGATNGMAGIDLGHPGTSKSLMIKVGPQIVEGIEREDIAKVPHRMDLQPAQLVGDTSEVVRTTQKGDEEPTREAMTQELKAILHPGAKAVILDEITRTSPYALNAGLEIMQDGRIGVYVDGEMSYLTSDEIDIIVAASNNYGTAFTNKLDPAIIGRFGMGTFTGVRPEGEDEISDVMREMVENDTIQYGVVDSVTKVIDRNELHVMRRAIQVVPMRAPEKDYFMKLNNKMLRTMEDNPLETRIGINMGDGRSTQQLLRVSKALAMLGNAKTVEQEHILEASRYFATAKLGLLPGSSEAKIDQFVDNINKSI